MSKVNDPFEEYLRKKKVELLETKFRDQASDPVEAPEEPDDYVPPSNEDPELEARVKEEVDEFFDASKDAGAKLFTKAGTGLAEEKVDEIRDALADVFEEDEAQPQTGEDDKHSFVDFFRQVNDEFDDEAGPSEPSSQSVEAERIVAEPIVAEPIVAEPQVAQLELAPEETAPLAVADDLAATANEVSTDDLIAVEVSPEPSISSDGRLSLNDILTPPTNEDELLQRVELLGRIVTKLVERVKLPENEIIEVLIRSGVEF